MRIFLSHATVDKPLVRQLGERLPSHVRPWLDMDDLYAGHLLKDEIRRAILDENDYFIVFMSAASLASDWVQREVQWALERERDLRRTFVVPVLLPGAPMAPPEASAMKVLWQRLYITWQGAGARAASRAADELARHLFALVSDWMEKFGDSSLRRFLASLEADLTRFKDLAFLLIASMGPPLSVLGTRPEAHAQFAQAVADYNAFASDFIARKDAVAAEARARFGGYLGEECDKLMDFIDAQLWRGRAFALNAIVDDINAYELLLRHDAARLEQAEQRKTTLLAETRKVVEQMERRSRSLLRKLQEH